MGLGAFGLRLFRRLAHAALTGLMLITGGASVLALAQSPFAQPLVAQSTAQARLALERAMAREVTADWLLPRLEGALATGDVDRIRMLSGLATQYGVPLSPETWAAIDAALVEPGLATQAYDCAACAVNIESCASLSQIATCALPFEMTVAGDANALRRQAQAAMAGEEVDKIETGLALVGIGATVAVLVTGGTSYAVKAGASFLRVARRMKAITPAFGRVLADAADLPVNWEAVIRGAPLREITDLTKLARLARLTEHLGTIRANTSTAEALVLVRYVDTAEDAASLARLSAITGRQTRATMEVLGKARAFRALVRVTDLALATIGLVAAFVAQLGMLALSLVLRLARRIVRPRPVARR